LLAGWFLLLLALFQSAVSNDDALTRLAVFDADVDLYYRNTSSLYSGTTFFYCQQGDQFSRSPRLLLWQLHLLNHTMLDAGYIVAEAVDPTHLPKRVLSFQYAL